MKTAQKYTNRLIKEKSPYLLQHAHNPVDWYPWGEEAFEKAKREDKPIFLSIGYSTCHWCHVMEEESFVSEEIAQLINTHFVPIKVDREERPDLDHVYMTAVSAMTGQGGWPLTVFLTPDKLPFFGGTYFPPYPKWGSPGLADLLQTINHSWQTNRMQIIDSGQSITQILKERFSQQHAADALTKDIVEKAVKTFSQIFDPQYGGFGNYPKFPTSHNLSFLLRAYLKNKDKHTLHMVELTLEKMALGGMYDQIAGGFHRYSTDRNWQIPHFEKMLYDQAILARTYLEAYQLTHKPFYKKIATEVFEYVLRDMLDPLGGFYSAEDADSLDDVTGEKKEGAFFLWREDELQKILHPDEFKTLQYYANLNALGNALVDPHGEFSAKNVIFASRSIQETAEHLTQSPQEVENLITSAYKKLFAVREKRTRPHLDDKVLVDWNALMIGTLAYGGVVLKDDRYINAAQKAADFILANLVKEGRLLHRYRQGEAAILGNLSDYSGFILALLDLYEATFNPLYIEKAEQLMEDTLRLFWDKESGGFFFTAQDAEKLIFNHKEIYDGAIPSGNSLAALALMRLYHFKLDVRYKEYAEKTFKTFSKEVSDHPHGHAQMLIAFDFYLGPAWEVVISAQKDKAFDQVLHEINQIFWPNKTISYDLTSKDLSIKICQEGSCQLPMTTMDQLKKALTSLSDTRKE